MRLLTPKQREKHLETLSGWKLDKKGTQITKIFRTKTFLSGLSFIARIAVHAELLDHHPTIELAYKTVTVTTTTHDLKGLTKLDIDLAKRIDTLQIA
jgi:4a-hydroxytetrahydrobiopterin dehydratase